MLSELNTVAINGLDTDIVRVETDNVQGLPSMTIVGLPDTTVREARERVHSAISNSGFSFPSRKITINLAPADTKKLGSHFDLPIAVGVFTSSEKIDMSSYGDSVFLGELSLGGEVMGIENCLSLLIGTKQKAMKRVFLPESNIKEASLIAGLALYPVSTFSQIAGHLSGRREIDAIDTDDIALSDGLPAQDAPDFAEVLGQERAKRAFTISAAGGHDLMMVGSPGSGKTMLARRMASILPDLSYEELLEVTKIYSIAGECLPDGLARGRPFRAPHHSLSSTALIGGGSKPRPGEISLAHKGVLFLDELTEFRRHALDTLRQPLEDGYVSISRTLKKVKYPCEFILITAMNPCPCGYYGHPSKQYSCGDAARVKYFSKVSGPLRDRMDLCLDIAPVAYDSFAEKSGECGMSSAEMKSYVEKATAVQAVRYADESIKSNARLSPAMIERYCALDAETEKLLEEAYKRYSFSARAGIKIKKVARTIADIEGTECIKPLHMAEAISFRLPGSMTD